MSNNETNDLLREILKWQRIIGLEYLKKKVEEEKLFKDKRHITVYYHSDGSKSSREIGKIVGFEHKTITKLWKQWSKVGIVELSKKYRGNQGKRLFELHELDIEQPEEQ